MASALEQINEIQTKDELIKWLINEYVFYQLKLMAQKMNKCYFKN